MSHITCNAERVENEEIWACPHRSVHVSGTWMHPITGDIEDVDVIQNQCGLTERVAVGKERCLRCRKTMTY